MVLTPHLHSNPWIQQILLPMLSTCSPSIPYPLLWSKQLILLHPSITNTIDIPLVRFDQSTNPRNPQSPKHLLHTETWKELWHHNKNQDPSTHWTLGLTLSKPNLTTPPLFHFWWPISPIQLPHHPHHQVWAQYEDWILKPSFIPMFLSLINHWIQHFLESCSIATSVSGVDYSLLSFDQILHDVLNGSFHSDLSSALNIHLPKLMIPEPSNNNPCIEDMRTATIEWKRTTTNQDTMWQCHHKCIYLPSMATLICRRLCRHLHLETWPLKTTMNGHLSKLPGPWKLFCLLC